MSKCDFQFAIRFSRGSKSKIVQVVFQVVVFRWICLFFHYFVFGCICHEGSIHVACQVAVLEGRHFQDFATGDSGVVIRSDVDAQTCQVWLEGMGEDGFLGKGDLSVGIFGVVRIQDQTHFNSSKTGK